MGRFEDHVMRGAQEAEVIGYKCNKYGLMEVTFSKPHGPIIEYWPPTNTSFGAGPELPDPFEFKYVEVGNSSIPNSGQGVLAKKDLKPGDTAAFIGGYLYRNEEEMHLYSERYIYCLSICSPLHLYSILLRS